MILNFLKGFYVDKKRIPTNFEEKIKNGIKIHTIRLDANNRWKKGMRIHFSTGSRTSNYNCFKEGVCTGTQEIEITKSHFIYIDGKQIFLEDFKKLVNNDGFDDSTYFWAWFDQYIPFEGKIIHWTDFRY